jgi:Cof subfamily protein (haloacid dehalogenase superfamily)
LILASCRWFSASGFLPHETDIPMTSTSASQPRRHSSGELPFDLVILDLDGTILRHDGTVSAAVAAAIADVQAAGIPVTIATGRILDYVRDRSVELGISTPVVTTQGAVIGDPVSGRLLREWTIAHDAARMLAAWADERRQPAAFFFNDDAGHTHIVQNLPPPDDNEHDYDYIMGSPRTLVGPLLPALEARTRGNGDLHEPVKFLVVSDVRTEAGLAATLQERFGPTVTVIRTHPLLVEVTAPGVDKGSGVLHLCGLLGVAPARVLAVGDNDNDITMFRATGTAVAVANGSQPARDAAHWVAPSMDEDGVAVALRALVHHDGSATARLLRSPRQDSQPRQGAQPR